MKVFLLGATGNTGYAVLRRLLSENHTVCVLVRNPAARLSVSELSAGPNQLTIVEGSVGDGDKLVSHMSGCKAVISALGTGLKNVNTDIYSEGGRNILK